MKQMLESVDKDFKTVFKTESYMSKNVKEVKYGRYIK